MQSFFTFLVRLVLLMAGLVFAASLMVAVGVLLVFWGLRALWAKLTGQPISPFVMRIDPRTGFGRVYRGAPGATPPPPPPPPGPPQRPGSPPLDDVTDVEVKEIRPHKD